LPHKLLGHASSMNLNRFLLVIALGTVPESPRHAGGATNRITGAICLVFEVLRKRAGMVPTRCPTRLFEGHSLDRFGHWPWVLIAIQA
jgi:hypothetical protein